jgi:hypothetical protein
LDHKVGPEGQQTCGDNGLWREYAMRKLELYPDCRDLFEYYGNKEIERIRFKGRHPVRRDWLVFDSIDAAMLFFKERCGVMEGRYIAGY